MGFFLFLYFIAAAGSFAYWPLNKPVGTGGGGVGGGGGEFIRSGRRGSVGSFVNKLVETRPEKMKNCGTLEVVFWGEIE